MEFRRVLFRSEEGRGQFKEKRKMKKDKMVEKKSMKIKKEVSRRSDSAPRTRNSPTHAYASPPSPSLNRIQQFLCSRYHVLVSNDVLTHIRPPARVGQANPHTVV